MPDLPADIAEQLKKAACAPGVPVLRQNIASQFPYYVQVRPKGADWWSLEALFRTEIQAKTYAEEWTARQISSWEAEWGKFNVEEKVRNF